MADPSAILRLDARMKQKRQTDVESVWRECFDFTFPLRGNGLEGRKDTASSGQAQQAALLDNTAGDSAGILASEIVSGMTPASALWFALDVGDEDETERRWLDDSAKLLWENIHMSNFDAEAFETALDIVSAGMFALFIDEDREQGGLEFQQWPLGQCRFASTRADGRVDIVHREYALTAEQALREFGEDALPETIRKALEAGKGDTEFKFLHAIYPRKPYVVGARMAKNLPIASCHIEMESKREVRESGFHEMPVIVPRWLRVSGSVYAVGPMYTALPACRQLNEFLALELAGADIAVSGMWLGIDDGVFNPRAVKLGPRKIIIAADKDSLTPLSSGADFSLSENKIRNLQSDIRRTLMADNFPSAEAPMKTAYEWSVRVEMLRKLLGPIWGRLQAEYLKPMIERCFGIAYRAGVFAPPPERLRGQSFKVRYVSPMARAQKLEDVNAIEATWASAATMANVMPEVLDELDARESLRLLVEGRGAPNSIRRKPEDVAKLRAEREEQAKRQQAEAGALQAQQVGMETAAKRGAR